MYAKPYCRTDISIKSIPIYECLYKSTINGGIQSHIAHNVRDGVGGDG